ncbi:EAL domain-containing protein [uncultured Propionivibrio sp.]|uniref:putative bifunctional diguanylate cyclase/phosphodiesterase n=1 Tax=uncultured Propionivibrio sp. TaxID=426737 RepID=UPI0029C0563D|nr:EAL domain-containing protein [uncultured Propionivibrio sp.]
MIHLISTEDSAAIEEALRPREPETSAAPDGAQGKPQLLLVDDEPRMLDSLVALLDAEAYELSTAASGAEAYAHLQQRQFDLILLDLRLPDCSGHDIMAFVCANTPQTKVIIVSGETDIEGAVSAMKQGAYDYLRKPYSRTDLLKTVQHALAQRRLEGENQRISWQLECSEKLYRYLVDSSPDIIYTLDPDGRFTYVNSRIQKLLGYTPTELIGEHYSAIVHDEDLERARYVFNERRVGERASRNIELRLKNLHQDDERTFDNTFMTISFNSMGMYSQDRMAQNRQYFGTYGVARDITERKRAEQLISYQAYHDILTDLPNRILFKDRLGLAIAQSQRKCCDVAVMFIDLDRFKLINDTLGHVKGDELLQQAAARLKDCLRKSDTLARVGGDEFTVVLPELHSRQDAEIISAKFLEALRHPFFLDGIELYISASIGIAVYPHDGESIDELLRHADIAMYHIKGSGKNGYSFFDPSMLVATYQKVVLEKDLRHALDSNEFELYYQPHVDSRNGEIIGAEALMRWNHPERGLVSAGEFLPFAEENGLMIPISDWMLSALCRDLLKWKAAGLDAMPVSFNISPQYLDHRDCFDKISATLAHYGIAPSQVEAEITENLCIRSPLHAIEQLHKLSSLGVNIAIDDFGTGYSSLSYLHRFPVHKIKIDQAFVRAIESEQGHYPVILAIISIARGLNLQLVAEGVETETQIAYLENNGCTTIQGYFYSPPIPCQQFIRMAQEKLAIRA